MCAFSSQVYSLSIENWHWKEHTADVEGEAPTPRSGHSAVALPGDRFLLVFGGGIPDQNAFFGTVSLLDTFTWTWTVPTITVRLYLLRSEQTKHSQTSREKFLWRGPQLSKPISSDEPI